MAEKVTGPLLAAMRIERRLTQRAVAKQLGVDPVTLCRWENSEQLPRRVAYAVLYALDMMDGEA